MPNRAPYGFHRGSRPTHFDPGRPLPPEKVEQQFTRRPGDTGRGLTPPCPNGPSGPRPLDLKTGAAQPPGQKPRRPADIAPQSLIHRLLIRSGTTAVSSAN